MTRSCGIQTFLVCHLHLMHCLRWSPNRPKRTAADRDAIAIALQVSCNPYSIWRPPLAPCSSASTRSLSTWTRLPSSTSPNETIEKAFSLPQMTAVTPKLEFQDLTFCNDEMVYDFAPTASRYMLVSLPLRFLSVPVRLGTCSQVPEAMVNSRHLLLCPAWFLMQVSFSRSPRGDSSLALYIFRRLT